MVETSAAVDDIRMSSTVWDAMMELREFLFERVYTAPTVTVEVEKATHLIEDLFDYYVDHVEEVPREYRDIPESDDLRAVADYVAGMTDRYAKNLYQQLFIPHSLLHFLMRSALVRGLLLALRGRFALMRSRGGLSPETYAFLFDSVRFGRQSVASAAIGLPDGKLTASEIPPLRICTKLV